MRPLDRFRKSPVSIPQQLTVLLPGLVIPLLAAAACAQVDPLQNALRERRSLAVDLLSWAPAQGRILLEVEIQGSPETLSRLTVLITQYDSLEEPLRSDRIPLDLESIHATGSMQTFASVPMADSKPVSVSVEVEFDPPAEALGEFPELSSLADGG